MLVHMLHQGSQFHTVFIYNHEVYSMLNIYDSVPYLPVSIQIQDECSALLLASKNGHIEVVKFLFKKGGKIHDKDYVTLPFVLSEDLFIEFEQNVIVI